MMSTTPERSPAFITSGLLVLTVIFPIIATAAVGLRFYARRIKAQDLKADDWTILFCLVRVR